MSAISLPILRDEFSTDATKGPVRQAAAGQAWAMTADLHVLHGEAGHDRWITTRGPIQLVDRPPPGVPASVPHEGQRRSPGSAPTGLIPHAPRGQLVGQRIPLALRFAEMLAETLRGVRPVSQLRSVSNGRCIATVTTILRCTGLGSARCVRVRASSPRRGVLDAVACYSWRPAPGSVARTFAVTFRLRQSTGGWRCSELEFVAPTSVPGDAQPTP